MKRILLPLLILSVFAASMSAQRGNNIDARKLQLALYAISNLYVDSTSETKLVEDAIVGMLEKLDPHSTYTDPEETKEMTEPLQGNFDGIGIQFNMLTDTLYVIQVIPGGPSEKVGLMAGDRIIMVDDTLIAGVKMKNTDVMKRLRGPKNTEVRVKVLRGGVPDLIEFKITRGKIPVYSLDAAYMADKTTGYIKLNRFAASSADEFREALESDPDKVQEAFTKSKETGAATDGLMASLTAITDKYADTDGDVKGILIEKAGSQYSPTSALDNTLLDQMKDVEDEISKWQDKMSDKVDYYTNKFTQLEVLINEMNSQSSALSGMLGG